MPKSEEMTWYMKSMCMAGLCLSVLLIVIGLYDNYSRLKGRAARAKLVSMIMQSESCTDTAEYRIPVRGRTRDGALLTAVVSTYARYVCDDARISAWLKDNQCDYSACWDMKVGETMNIASTVHYTNAFRDVAAGIDSSAARGDVVELSRIIKAALVAADGVNSRFASMDTPILSVQEVRFLTVKTE